MFRRQCRQVNLNGFWQRNKSIMILRQYWDSFSWFYGSQIKLTQNKVVKECRASFSRSSRIWIVLSNWCFPWYTKKEKWKFYQNKKGADIKSQEQSFTIAQKEDALTSFWRPSLELDKSLLSRPFGRLHTEHKEGKCLSFFSKDYSSPMKYFT